MTVYGNTQSIYKYMFRINEFRKVAGYKINNNKKIGCIPICQELEHEIFKKFYFQ